LRGHQGGGGDPIAAIVLGLVQGIVGGDENAVGHLHRLCFVGLRGSHANTGGDKAAAVLVPGVGDFQLSDSPADFLRDLESAWGVGAWEDERELLSSIPGDDVEGSTGPGSRNGGDGAKAIISGLVSVLIVEPLEAVDVEEKQGHLGAFRRVRFHSFSSA
jgi:hypothetical protein